MELAELLQLLDRILGGRGGGRPNMAQGGGKDISKLDTALAKLETLLAEQIKA